MISGVPVQRIKSPYGTIPSVATADGRDRIPSDMFSATITRSKVSWTSEIFIVDSYAFQLACKSSISRQNQVYTTPKAYKMGK
jgi:hypothetical protein